MRSKTKFLVIVLFVVNILVACEYSKEKNDLDLIIESLNKEKIERATLYSNAIHDDFEMQKEDAMQLFDTLKKNQILKTWVHDREYYYNEIVFYDNENKKLLVVQCINPTGRKKNQQVIVGNNSYEVKEFYRVLYEIGKKYNYYLDFDKL